MPDDRRPDPRPEELFKPVLELALSGEMPQSSGLVIPEAFHNAALKATAEILLCLNGLGGDECGSCKMWDGDSHPDLVVIGSTGKPPGIDDCRTLKESISLKPVVAPCRLAVIHGADRFSLPAANSLLKIAEEPPSKGRLFFLFGEDNMLPTLRSRLRLVTVRDEDRLEPTPPPQTAGEFVKWMKKTRKSKIEDIIFEIESWGSCLVAEGLYDKAAAVENIRLIARRGKINAAMAQDLLFLALMEGIDCGEFLDDIW